MPNPCSQTTAREVRTLPKKILTSPNKKNKPDINLKPQSAHGGPRAGPLDATGRSVNFRNQAASPRLRLPALQNFNLTFRTLSVPKGTKKKGTSKKLKASKQWQVPCLSPRARIWGDPHGWLPWKNPAPRCWKKTNQQKTPFNGAPKQGAKREPGSLGCLMSASRS